MTGKEQLAVQRKPLTYYLDGGGTLFRASCPELDIAHYGESPEAAIKELFELAKAEVIGINLGKGDWQGKPDDRRPLAESLKEIEDISSAFERIPGPAPMKGGL